jgi:hypothetical protein
LPNIDINIKCGNSLIARFGLDADLKKALKQSKWNIESYKIAVDTYRNAESKEQKKDMERLIADIKGNFRSEIGTNDPKKLSLEKKKGELFNYTQQVGLFERSKKEQTQWNKTVNTLSAEVQKLETDIEEIKSNKIYENAFEWRFEFPEVLNDAGDFVGFDVVIGNPPYGVNFSDVEKKYLTNFDVDVPDYEIYIYFTSLTQKILRQNGLLSFIFPNTFLSTKFGIKYRLKLFSETQVYQIVDLSNDNTFEDASVRTCIFSFQNNNKDYSSEFIGLNQSNFYLKEIFEKKFLINQVENLLSLFNQNKNEISLIHKIKSFNKLSDYLIISQGLIPYDKYRGHDEFTIKNRIWHSDNKKDDTYKKELKGGDIDRYSTNWNGKLWISYGPWLAAPRNVKFFTQKRILIREITADKLQCSLVTEEFYNTPSLINVICENEILDLKYCLAILNSNLIGWYHNKVSPKANKGLFPKILINDVRNIPLVEISIENQQPFIEKVDQILTLKQSNPSADTSLLEREIDLMVYELYGLSEEEIGVVEGDEKR